MLAAISVGTIHFFGMQDDWYGETVEIRVNEAWKFIQPNTQLDAFETIYRLTEVFVFLLDLERTLGLINGNVMHLEMSLDQMFAFRPLPELAQYKTPIPGLFLTAASTHPGGGVFGASGLSAAQVVGPAIKRKLRRGRRQRLLPR